MKSKMYQVFDSDGVNVGSVTGITIADASRKAREGYCAFPTLVEMPTKIAISIWELVEEKTRLEIDISEFITQRVVVFEEKMKVPVKAVYTRTLDTFSAPSRIEVEIELDINNIR